MSEQTKTEEKTVEEKKLEGLGGWLILVAISIIFSPIRIVTQIFPLYSGIFTDGTWQILTTPGAEAYNPLWAPILIGELGINSLLILAWGFVAFLFFKKKASFPKWYIGILLFQFTFIIADAFSVKSLMPNEPVFDPETTKEVMRTLVAMLIWIPYMLVSKRVKATFVK
jgi:hypothetical protein